MGIDLNSLWGQAQDAIKSGIKQVEDQGVPALTAAAENWGANVLSTQAKQAQATLNTNLKNAPPAEPGSFASYLQGTLGNAVAHDKGPLLIIGALVVLVGGFYLMRK